MNVHIRKSERVERKFVTPSQARRRRKLAMQRDADRHVAKVVAMLIRLGIILRREKYRAIQARAPYLRAYPRRLAYVLTTIHEILA